MKQTEQVEIIKSYFNEILGAMEATLHGSKYTNNLAHDQQNLIYNTLIKNI